MIALCSDLDETPDLRVYLECMRFLNTTEPTSMGRGVGLETGNSIYFDMPPGQVSYWNADERDRPRLRTLMRSGHIDCLHSFGDLATSRGHAGRALDELSRYGCRPEVWVDHAVAPTNLGGDIMRGTGDVPGSAAYHADLTCAFGIKYVWRGRVTSVIGQNTARSLRGIVDRRRPAASSRTWAKETAKGLLARAGDRSRYAMHHQNQVLRDVCLRDGQPVQEFIRGNPHWGGVSCGDTADGLADVLTRPTLEELIRREGVCVLYTHLGKVSSTSEPFGAATRGALRLLADYAGGRELLVTTTRRLLGYCAAADDVTFAATQDGPNTAIAAAVSSGAGPDDLQGLTFYVGDPRRTTLTINGASVLNLTCNSPDETAQPSVSVPWSCLEYPRL